VLPEQFTQDLQRLARFEREAKLLAQLNHPNIAAIYGFEKAEGVHFLALELVPGETLQKRVAKGPLPVEEALEICRQIAEGVEAAHEKGVIHRDLKPANVKVTPEGKVKILDFGLAKAFEDETPVTDISQSPTLTEEMTRAGVILGTAAYMSPEQAKGKPVDKRADVFAFGAVLYELLTGKRAFEGETITETIAAVLKSEPDWEKLPIGTPWRIKELLQDCFQKEAHDRLHDIANVRIQIKKSLKEPASPTDVASAVQPVQQRWGMTVGLVVLGAVTAGLVVWFLVQPSPPAQTLNKFVITPSPPARLANNAASDVAISPEGRHLVYSASGEDGINQLYLRSLDEFVDSPIPGTEFAMGGMFFSPDGESVGFFGPRQLRKVSLAGGSPITICNVSSTARKGGWFGDTIFFSGRLESGQGLYRVPAAGGEPELLAAPNPDEGEQSYRYSQILPGGKALLFTIGLVGGDAQVAALSLETKESKLVLENARQAYYLPTGHVIYEQVRTGNLMAAPFDPVGVEVVGDSVSVVQGVRQGQYKVDYVLSDEGMLVYVPSTGTGGFDRTLVWVDREGQEEPLALEPQGYESPRISPDGSRIAITIDESGGSDVWLYDLEREILTRLTFDPAADHNPVWTPDGQRIVFDSGRVGTGHNLFWKAADGTGQVERLATGSYNQTAHSISPDGKRLVFGNVGTPRDLLVLSMEGERTSQPLFQSQFNETRGRISPDGHWIAYESDESGQQEIYIRPFPNVEEGKWQISRDGGTEPAWSPLGQELFFRNGGAMMVVGIKTEPTFMPGSPVVLFTGRYTSGIAVNYDISPDGQRFLMIKEDEGQPGQINVVFNWFEELKRLVPTP
jgi:serine/threonine-protein kinase